MKLFNKLIKGKKDKERKNSGSVDRQNSTNSRSIPEFVGGSPDVLDDSDLSDHSRSFSPYVTATARNEADEMSISRPDDDPSFPLNRVRVASRGRVEEAIVVDPIVEQRSSPQVGSLPRETSFVDHDTSMYQSESHLNRSTSQMNSSFTQQPPMYPPPGLTPQELMEINRLMAIGYSYDAALGMLGIGGPNQQETPILAPPSHSPMLPMQPLPGSMYQMTPPMMMPGYYPPPPGPLPPYQSYYGSPYGSMIIPPHGAMPPPAPAPGYDYYRDNEEDLRLAMQLSLQEEEQRRQQLSEEERMVKEAVERANERAVQIALQRSFEEQFGEEAAAEYAAALNRNGVSQMDILHDTSTGPRSVIYHPHHGQQQSIRSQQSAIMMTSSQNISLPSNTDPQAQQHQQQEMLASASNGSPNRRSIGRPASVDYGIIHYGSVEIDDVNPMRWDEPAYDLAPEARNLTMSSHGSQGSHGINPLRQTGSPVAVPAPLSVPKPEDRPGAYHEKPSRPMSNNSNNSGGSNNRSPFAGASPMHYSSPHQQYRHQPDGIAYDVDPQVVPVYATRSQQPFQSADDVSVYEIADENA